MRRWCFDRVVPYTPPASQNPRIISFEVEADRPWEARDAADELVLAVAQHRGQLDAARATGHHVGRAEPWALALTSSQGVR